MSQRVEHDLYPTPPALAEFVVRQVAHDFFAEDEPVNVMEPGCGRGSFLEAIRRRWPAAWVDGYEVQKDVAREAAGLGFRMCRQDMRRLQSIGDYHLVIGNPPFGVADVVLPQLMDVLDPFEGVCALLLRLNYLAGQERYRGFWSRWPPSLVYVLPKRPGFTPDGKTDQTDYMVCVWSRRGGPVGVRHLDNLDVECRWAPEPVVVRRRELGLDSFGVVA